MTQIRKYPFVPGVSHLLHLGHVNKSKGGDSLNKILNSHSIRIVSTTTKYIL